MVSVNFKPHKFHNTMKTFFKPIIKALVLGVSVFVSSLAIAQNAQGEKKPFEVAMYPAADASKVWMNVVKHDEGRRLRIEMLDAKKQVLYSSTTAKSVKSFRQRFDLREIKDGVYTFRITDGTETTERSFRISTPGVQEELPKRLITMANTANEDKS